MDPIGRTFDYDPDFPRDIRDVATRINTGAIVREFTFATPFNRRRAAYMVRPEEELLACPLILFVHWYEPQAPDSNRNQFMQEAIKLANQGCISLLVETMWSDLDWFIKRTQAEDFQSSVEQVVELRIAMDLLLAERGADPNRFAYVGHDFGAMYGILTGAVDPRPTAYVLMAGTPRFPDWFLYYPKLPTQEVEAFKQEFAPVDPITLLPRLAPAPLFFQFGVRDEHVPTRRAEEFYAAATEPKELWWYESGHGLNENAANDRLDWLVSELNLEGD